MAYGISLNLIPAIGNCHSLRELDGTSSLTAISSHLDQCENYFAFQNLTDEQQIRFTLQLMEGDAESWMRQQMQLMRRIARPPHIATWGAFVQEFSTRFVDAQERANAAASLYSGKIVQTTSARLFIDKIQDLAEKAGINDDNARMDLIRLGLKEEVLRATALYTPAGLADYIATVVTADENLQRIKGRNSTRKPQTSNTSTSQNKGQSSTPREDLSKFKLTEAERKEHAEQNLCFKCHKKGHASKDCKGERTVYSEFKKKATVSKVAAKPAPKPANETKAKISEVKPEEEEGGEANDEKEEDFSEGN